MAGKSNAFSDDVLKLVFLGTAIANIADNAGTGPLTDLYIALHTADPTAAGTQDNNECTYTGYGRVLVARASGGFAESGQQVQNVADIVFGACTAGSETATHWSVGVAVSGATKILYSGAISSPAGGLAISSGITPKIPANDLTITES